MTTATRTSSRRTGDETKTAIKHAAIELFGGRGFDATSLEVIAAQIGVSRTLVLHHFASKAEVLDDTVRPVMARIDELLDRAEASGPVTVRRQRGFLTEFVDLLCEHRAVATILILDITAHRHLAPELQITDRAERFAGIVTVNTPGPGPSIRALAALGAIVRPLSAPESLVDLSGPEHRAILVECAPARGAAQRRELIAAALGRLPP